MGGHQWSSCLPNGPAHQLSSTSIGSHRKHVFLIGLQTMHFQCTVSASCHLCDNDIHSSGHILVSFPCMGGWERGYPHSRQTDRQTHLHSQSWEVFVSQPHFNIAPCCRAAIETVVGYLGNKMKVESEIWTTHGNNSIPNGCCEILLTLWQILFSQVA